ncbi:MAG TPA: choice-of-anchor Q domain-containing protein, partial [Kofleriaceae bacterium]|nr:choice-of-anchor Q domain-containing protein [Kofleriaceae bacterium]
VAMPIVLTNSVVYDNGTGTQVEGANCSWTYSDIGPTAVSGTGNINAPPMFVDSMQGNFHLQSSSPAKDAADPAASLAVDIDGDTRPQGDGRDMGADEIR